MKHYNINIPNILYFANKDLPSSSI